MNKAAKLLELLSEGGATQKKVEAEITKIASDQGLDADFDHSYSNTGRVHFRKGLKTLANLHFDFQNNTAAFAFARGSHEAQYFGKNDKIFYIKNSDFDPLFSYLKQELSKLKA